MESSFINYLISIFSKVFSTDILIACLLLEIEDLSSPTLDGLTA